MKAVLSRRAYHACCESGMSVCDSPRSWRDATVGLGCGHQPEDQPSMKMSDERRIEADRETVWAALMSPEVLKECVPGAQEVSGSPDAGFEATVTQKVGPVKATFNGRVVMSEMVEPESLVISGEGKGGAAGFAKGGATVRLAEGDGGTILSYDVEAR